MSIAVHVKSNLRLRRLGGNVASAPDVFGEDHFESRPGSIVVPALKVDNDGEGDWELGDMLPARLLGVNIFKWFFLTSEISSGVHSCRSLTLVSMYWASWSAACVNDLRLSSCIGGLSTRGQWRSQELLTLVDLKSVRVWLRIS